jgi:hypothetical protein
MAPDGRPSRDLGRIPDDRADAFDEWMTRIAELDDAAVEGLLRGDTPEGCGDLAPVAGVTAALRHEATAHRPAMGPALRVQIAERPHVPPRYAGAPRRRLQLAVAAAAVLIVGVAATQNALPAAAQRAVSNVADLVGIDVPRPEGDADEAPSTSTEDTPSGSTDASDAPTGTDAPDGPRAAEPSGAEGETVTPGTGAPSSQGGPPESTPGGATPAEPGTPGDREPATPAVPPTHSNGGGNGNARGNGTGNGENGQANGANGRATAPGQPQGTGAPADQG